MSTKINSVTVDFEVDNFMLAYEIRDHQICAQLHNIIINKNKYSVVVRSLQMIGRIQYSGQIITLFRGWKYFEIGDELYNVNIDFIRDHIVKSYLLHRFALPD